MKISIWFLALSLIGCASGSKCPTETEQAVSTCRAETACGKGTFGHVFGSILSGMGSGLSHQPNAARNNYDSCIDRNIAAQKANAGLPDTTVRCKTRKVASDQTETVCN